MASTMYHHQKSHDETEQSDSDVHAGLRSISLPQTSSSSSSSTAAPLFASLTRTNTLHEKHSESTSSTTSTTTTSSNSIQHMISLRDIPQQQEDNPLAGSIELHQKHSREKYIANPKKPPTVWSSTTSTKAAVDATTTSSTTTELFQQATTAAVQQVATASNVIEEVSRVNPAPTPYEYGDSSAQQGTTTSDPNIQTVNPAPHDETTPCHLPPIPGQIQRLTSFGSHSSKNPGIVLRYRYELVQDLTGIDWTINEKGERDGTDALVENVLPMVEEGMLGEVLVPTLFEECDKKKRGIRGLSGLALVGIDVKPDDFPLPQTECITTYIPEDPLKSIQCHRIEGAMTLYFAESSPYSALLPSVTLQALNAIKDGMDTGMMLSSQESVLALTFLDSSYSLESIVPAAAPDTGVASKSSSGGNGGLAAGLVIFFLLLGIGAFFGWRKYKKMPFELDQYEQEREDDVAVDINHVSDLKDSTRSEDDEDASYTSNDSETSGGDGTTDDDNTGDEGGSYSEESTDSDGIFEDDDSFDPEDINSPGYHMYKKKKNAKKSKNNIVIGGVVDEASVATGATGATGLHSAASLKTVKVKNVVLPNVLDVDINMG